MTIEDDTYRGVERRSPNTCPLTFEQAEKILLNIQALNIRFDTSHKDLLELKNYIKEMKTSMCDRITKIDSKFNLLESDYEKRKSYVAGSLEGAKIGAKSGVIFVIITVLGGGLFLFLILTGQIDIFNFFKEADDALSTSVMEAVCRIT